MHDPPSLHKYAYVHGDPIQGVDPTGRFFGVGGALASMGISVNARSLNQARVYAGRQAAIAGLETALEVLIGLALSVVTGVPFDLDIGSTATTFGTNFVSNLATAGIGNKTAKAILIRNLLDFSIRTLSDVVIGGQDVMWAATVNVLSMGASGLLLAKYGRKLFGASVGRFGGCFVAGTPVVVGFENEILRSAECSVGNAMIATERKTLTKAVETIELGSRVITEAPDDLPRDREFGEPEQSTWRRIDMLQHRSDGTEIEMQLLRPAWWIELLKLEVGRVIDWQFPDLQTSGHASVQDVSPCPAIEDGQGRVVIGRFVTRDACNLHRVTLEDGTDITGTTTHPMWSIDADDWKSLESFSIGERVLTLNGETTVSAMAALKATADVFNLEVEGDHVYRILKTGVLVHNSNYVPDEAVTRLLANIADIPWGRFCENGCEVVARRIRDEVGGTIHRIVPNRGRFLGPRQGFSTQWQWHEAVVLNGRVYDALTGPEGVPVEVYKKLWKYADDLDFGF